MDRPQSQVIREQLAEHESARSEAVRALEELAVRRPALLLGPSDKAGDKALGDHDAAVAREHRAVERADAHLAELRPALARAEAAEQEAAVHDLAQHGADLMAAYEKTAREEYEPAARALAAIMRKMDTVRYDIERTAAALPTGFGRLQVESWRRQPDNNWRLPSLGESVKLPALRQGDRAIWDGEHRRPAVQRPVALSVHQDRPAWDPTKPARMERPDWANRLREIEQRSDAERRAHNSSVADSGPTPSS